MSNAPGKPVPFSRPKVGYFSNRPRTLNRVLRPSAGMLSMTLGLGFLAVSFLYFIVKAVFNRRIEKSGYVSAADIYIYI